VKWLHFSCCVMELGVEEAVEYVANGPETLDCGC
jgi:hypothetical protein